MPENVIVTLRFQGREADFELPAQIPLSAIAEPLKAAARLHFPGIMFQGKSILLRSAQGYLSPDRTLADYGIFDGALLELVLTDQAKG